MNGLVAGAQVVVALSVLYVWIFRFENIVREFREYRLPDTARNLVGASKIALATLLLAGLWYPPLVLVSALAMALLMVCAQIAHLSVRHRWHRYVPSLVLLALSLFVAQAAALRPR